jgi:hypothetical protein
VTSSRRVAGCSKTIVQLNESVGQFNGLTGAVFCGVAQFMWLDVEDGRLWQVWQRPRESVVEVEAASHTHIRTSVVSAGRDLV